MTPQAAPHYQGTCCYRVRGSAPCSAASAGSSSASSGRAAGTVWQVERERHLWPVLAQHWPDAERYEDVRDAREKALGNCVIPQCAEVVGLCIQKWRGVA